jgi:hypothetical protein
MKPNEIAGMLKALKPALRSHRKAEKILEEYWRDRQAIIWTVEQVHRAANERERVLTNAEARELLHEFIRHHNPQYGLKWGDLLEIIDQSVLGRRMTKKELKAFVDLDVLATESKKYRLSLRPKRVR